MGVVLNGTKSCKSFMKARDHKLNMYDVLR